MRRTGRGFALHATAAALGALLVATWRVGETQDARPTLSLGKTAATYLSSDARIEDTLTIDNPTDRPLWFYNSEIRFDVSIDGRPPYDWLPFPSMTNIGIVPLQPGKSRTITLPLPLCDVTGGACTISIDAKLPSRTARDEYRSQMRTYRIVLDPTATFRVAGLGGNRPLVLSRGDARATVEADRRHARLRISGSPNEGDAKLELDSISRIAASLPLDVSTGVDDAGDATVDLAQQNASSSALDEALARVRMSAGARLVSVTPYLEPAPDVIAGLVGSSEADDEREARALFAYLGVGVVNVASGDGLAERQTIRTIADHDVFSSSNSQLVPLERYSRDVPMRLAENWRDPQAVELEIATSAAFAGGSAASLTDSPREPSGIAYVGIGDAPTFASLLRATAVDDRPEIIAFGVTTRERAEQLGAAVEPLAAALAAVRARELARDLGVAAGPLTLAAAYRDEFVGPGTTVAAEAVAFAPDGDVDRGWRPLAETPAPVASTPRPGTQAAPAPLPAPTPTPSPTPTPEAGRTQPTPTALPTYDVPIAETDGASLSTGTGDDATSAGADGIELRVAFASRDPYRSVPMPERRAVEGAVAGTPSIVSIAVQRVNGIDSSFTIELSRIRRSDVATLADRLMRFARRRALSASFGVSLASDDCATALARARSDSLGSALRSAVATSRARNVVPSRLVLAIAEPESAEGGSSCRDTLMPPGDTPLDGRAVARALPSAVVVHAPVRVIFRTTARR